MAKIKFAEIALIEKALEPTIIEYAGQHIEVKKTIPITDKYNLITITLQESEEDGVYNEVKLDMYFTLNMVFKYTNIEFAAEDRIAQDELFDKLNNSGLLAKIITAIPEDEKERLYNYLSAQVDMNLKYGNNIAAVVRSFIDRMPKNAEEMKEIVDSFNPEKWQAVVDFAQAANGGRPISLGRID